MSRLVLFTGADPYLLDEAIRDYIRKQIPKDELDWNVEYIYEEIPLSQLMTLADSQAFMGEKRLIMLKAVDFLLEKKKGGTQSTQQKEFMEYASDNTGSNILLLRIPLAQKDWSAYLKKLANYAEIYEISSLEGVVLWQWLEKIAQSYGMRFSREVPGYLESQGWHQDAGRLALELHKALLYWQDEEVLTIKHLKAVFSETIEVKVFALTDAILNGQSKQALMAWDNLFSSGESSDKLWYLLQDQLKTILMTQAFTKKGISEKEMATLMKKHPYVVKKASQFGRRLREVDLLLSLNVLKEFLVSRRQEPIFSDKDAFNDLILMLVAILNKKNHHQKR